jgi:hypothetical protein
MCLLVPPRSAYVRGQVVVGSARPVETEGPSLDREAAAAGVVGLASQLADVGMGQV